MGSRIVNIIIVIAIIIVVNILANVFYTQFDLTEDKRFTLTEESRELIVNVDEPIYVKVLLEGSFPVGFKRLQEKTREMLDKFHSINGNIEYEFENPTLGSGEEVKLAMDELAKDGIVPVNLRIKEGGEMTNKPIFPYAIFNLGGKKVIVNILEDQMMNVSQEVTLNNSISLLEYKFADAVQKLNLDARQIILFTEGRGELPRENTAALQRELSAFYSTGRINLDSTYRINPEVDLVVVAKPTKLFSDRDQFIMDQYIMNGGKVIWLIDYLNVTVDSINQNKYYVPSQYDLGLDDLWFKYGVRFQPNLVLDMESSTIPQVIGSAGGRPQIEQIKWPYHPIAFPSNVHNMTRNIGRVSMHFPSSIDTIATKTRIVKTPVLKSSPYTMFQFTPVRLSFDILKVGFDNNNFNKPPKDLAVLLEGRFESLFKNRLAESMEESLKQIDATFVEESPETKQLFISDGDLFVNQIDPNTGGISPIGYNPWEKKVYKGNEEFMLNAISYMLDNGGVLSARSKEVKLRLIDTVKVEKEKTKWRIINIVLPLLLLALFGIGYNGLRKRRYGV